MIETNVEVSKELEKALQELQRALSVLRQRKGETTIPLRKWSLLPFRDFAFRQKPKCGFYLPTKFIHDFIACYAYCPQCKGKGLEYD